MAELISIRECARRIGVSDTAIHKAIKAGRISIAERHPTNGRPLMDFESVLQNWRDNTDPAMQRAAPGGGNGRMKSGSLVVEDAPLHPMRPGPRGGALKTGGEPREPKLPADGEEPEEEEEGGDGTPAYNVSRARREQYAAKKAKLDYEKEAGSLVSAEQVKAEAFRLARQLRDAIMTVPDRIDAELAAETNARKINLRLKAELISALGKLQTVMESAA